MNIDLNKFAEWQREKPKWRYVKMEINPSLYGAEIGHCFWVYDHELGLGQMVRNADEIDLEGKAAQKERDKYAELKAKYEGPDEDLVA